MKRKYRKNLSESVTKEFTGDRKEIIGSLPVSKLPKSLLLVGYLENLTCETPNQKKVDAGKLIQNNSGKKHLVCASGDGKLVLIISGDVLSPKAVDPKTTSTPDLEKAVELHTDFHGVTPEDIQTLAPKDLTHLEFFGWLKHIVYRVPKYSERAWPENTPYIHTAGDRGDDLPKAKKKPLVCFSPSKDMVIMFGEEMSFTDRGIIG